jgi:multidrug efflux system membrane fusion protein
MTARNRVFVLAATLLAGALACRHHTDEKAPARPVRVEVVRGEGVAGGLRYSTAIQPYEQVPLAFKVGGYVREVLQRSDADGRPRNLQQGDTVTRGTVLARVNPADYQERVNQAKAQVAEAEASLAKSRADAARAESLYQSKALTRPDYDAATAGLATAKARVEGARAQLETAQLSLNDASLVAPSDGVVLTRSVEQGALVGVGTVGFTVADLTRVKAVFGVPDLIVQRVQVGTPMHVTTDAYPGVEFPGRVTAVAPSADAQSRVFNVEVTIPNADRRLKAGMVGTVEVTAFNLPDIKAGSPTVSVAAVVKSAKGGAFAVFLADGPDEGATARSRDVSLGRISGNRVAVDAGLKVGDRVIVSGASLLVDGDRVRVIPGSEGE